MKNTLKKQSGFTLIELIIVIAIITIITSTAGVALSNFLLSSQINSYTNQLVQVMRKAQNRAFSSVYNSDWGLHFSEENSFTLFQGETYANSNSDTHETYEFPQSLSLKNIQNSEIVFQNVSGRIPQPMNFSVSNIEGEEYFIEINQLGKIEIK